MVAQLVIASVLELFDLRLAGALSALLLLCSIVVFYVYDRLAGLSSLAGEAPRRRGASGRMMGLLIALGRLADPLARTASRMRARAPLRLYTLGVVALLVLPVIIVIPIAFTRGTFVSCRRKASACNGSRRSWPRRSGAPRSCGPSPSDSARRRWPWRWASARPMP